MPVVIGFDTETMEGPPITVQFYSEHLTDINDCIFVTGGNVLDKSLRHLSKHCRKGEFVVYGHNLKFDLLSLFYSIHNRLATKRGEFEFTHRDWHISGVYGQPNFCVMKNDNATVTFVDTFSWFSTSLAKVSSLICPDLPKLPHPKGLGTTQYTTKDTDFIEYAMRDAEVAFHAGVQIDGMHKEFELRQALTVADMASKIFQQHYINEAAPIWNVGPAFNEGAVSSYHGGKNNVYKGAAPAWHSPVDAWDLSSAYPHAMTEMPAFSDPKLFRHAIMFSKRSRVFPVHGIYCISGFAEPCEWPVVFNEKFKEVHGPFVDVWITGYELNEARRMGEIKLSRVWGHIYDTENDPVTVTAFTRYVNYFYERKQSATDPVYRYMYKVLLNALYGKFIQSRQVDTVQGAVAWKHGPLYHPFVASLITGHTRGVMHRLEHETAAIHTATDGVFCGASNSPADGVFSWAPQEGLGAIESEGKGLELCLLRNKLYLLYSDEPGEGWHSFIRPDKYVAKYAKHGFQGSPKQLEQAAMTDVRQYEVNKPNTLKTAIKSGRVPNKFESRPMNLDVAPISVHFNHRKGKKK
jgi:hypothetical protein